jgi:hypothetical protein
VEWISLATVLWSKDMQNDDAGCSAADESSTAAWEGVGTALAGGLERGLRRLTQVWKIPSWGQRVVEAMADDDAVVVPS